MKVSDFNFKGLPKFEGFVKSIINSKIDLLFNGSYSEKTLETFFSSTSIACSFDVERCAFPIHSKEEIANKRQCLLEESDYFEKQGEAILYNLKTRNSGQIANLIVFNRENMEDENTEKLRRAEILLANLVKMVQNALTLMF